MINLKLHIKMRTSYILEHKNYSKHITFQNRGNSYYGKINHLLRFERRFVRMCFIFLIAYITIYSGSYKVESKGELITKILYIMTWSNS